MGKIVIIGSNGMLGSAVTRYLTTEKLDVLEVNRSGSPIYAQNSCLQFDILTDPLEKLAYLLSEVDYVINCAGLIKHKIDEGKISDIQKSIHINTTFPLQLANLAETNNLRIINIGTDCVYSGEKGNYSESDPKDPTDIYGITKLLGEISSPRIMTLRCSIIGRELSSLVSFLEWVLSQTHGSKLDGFQNHYWNGISTLHFAKIVFGVIKNGKFKSGTFHVIPADFVTKAEMIELAIQSFARKDLSVTKINASNAINRVLDTDFPAENLNLWVAAGYPKPISIAEMFSEYATWYKTEAS